MGKYVLLNDANFEQEVLHSDVPVLVDFWAEWCAPCRIIAPIVEELATEYEGKLKVGKLDVDNNPQVSMKYSIRSIPTLLIYKGGKPVEQIIGAVSKQNILEKLQPYL
ncbi:MAG TPA: thioredoxin [Calditrichaeota bacterium]|nr:thioredoxin [Calditrichota bacterium]